MIEVGVPVTRLAPRARDILVLAAALLIGVTSTAAQSPDVTTVELRVGDGTRFKPSEIHARPGERLRVVLIYVGQMAKTSVAHNFVLLKNGANAKAFAEKFATTEEPDFTALGVKDQVIVASSLIGAGETAELIFEAPAGPGEYPFVCTFKGHHKLGMKGELIVK